MNELIYFVNNNNGVLKIAQEEPDGTVTVDDLEIPPGDMVMLINYYRYIKENDIQNDFINPNGKNYV